MDENKEHSHASHVLSNEDSEDTVFLRRDSHTLRKNRRESRERTPTALVSQAFDFLNEGRQSDVISTVEVLEKGSVNFPRLVTAINEVPQELCHDNSTENLRISDEQDSSVCLRECGSRDDQPPSRERTTSGLVSQAFHFLKEEDFFGGDGSSLSPVGESDEDFVHLRQKSMLEDGAYPCKLKDSGFASLERQLDKEVIRTALSHSQFDTESGVSDKIQGSCDPSYDLSPNRDQNCLASDNQISKGDVTTSLVDESKQLENVSNQSDNTSHDLGQDNVFQEEGKHILKEDIVHSENVSSISASKSEQNIEANQNKCETSRLSSSSEAVQGITDRVALAMKILEGASVDDEADEEEDHIEHGAQIEENHHQESDSSVDQSLLMLNVKNNRTNDWQGTDPENEDTQSKIIKIERDDNEEASTDGSSDEDTGIYAESFRRSNWIRVSKAGKLRLHVPTPPPSGSSSSSSDAKDKVDGPEDTETPFLTEEVQLNEVVPSNEEPMSNQEPPSNQEAISNQEASSNEEPMSNQETPSNQEAPPSEEAPSNEEAISNKEAPSNEEASSLTSEQLEIDDVFEKPRSKLFHKRSDSTTSTTSEADFKRKYVSRRKCLVQRADSQQEYHRLSARVFEENKEVIVERSSDCKDLGLHLLDSHPAFITSVDPGSPADKAGIVEGQILVSVNDLSVLTTNHADIIELIQKCEGNISLGVANSDFQPVRDLQSPVIAGYLYKLGHSTLMKSWKRRYFILRHDNCLYYYKTEQELDPLGALPLCGYTISRHTETNKDFCFKAEKYGARSYFFMTDNRDQMTEWVGAMTQAAVRSKKRKESFLSVSSHNVSLPALDIRRPECSGFLGKMVNRSWRRRYCVLKDACIYYYKDVNSLSALGVAHLHGYTVDVAGHPKKKNSFILHPPDSKMRSFIFSVDNDTDKKRWVESLIHSIQRWVKVDS